MKAALLYLNSFRRLSALLCMIGIMCTGCRAPSAYPPHLLPISDQEQARAFIDVFFQAYTNNRFEKALTMLCAQDAESQAAALKKMQKHQGDNSKQEYTNFDVRSIVPMWIGREAYYRTEVSFPFKKRSGHLLEVYSIRVRDGCVDGFISEEKGFSLPGSSLPTNLDKEKIVLPPISEPVISPKTVPPTPINSDSKIEL
jgi:hypothetical protein